MKQDQKTQESIVALLTRIYMDIAEIEQEFNLIVGEGDFRPRIEYFHDAIRAFSAQEAASREAGGRLAVELLAYDLSCLRYVQSVPLGTFKPQGGAFSPSTDMLRAGGVGQELASLPRRPDRATRERLVELYKNYAVMFAALLKPFADADYQDRVDELNQDVQEINAIIAEIEKLSQGKGSVNTAAAIANQVENADLHRLLIAFLQEKRFKSPSDTEKLNGALKQENKKKDKQIKIIEDAHMNYALGQLGVYEESKDLLKKMAGQGVNLVGKFVEASIAETRRSMGR